MKRQQRRPNRSPPKARDSEAAAVPRPPSGQPWLYGRHTVSAALANPRRRIERLVALPEAAPELAQLAAGARAKLPEKAPEILDRRGFDQLLGTGAVHQGMALQAPPLAPQDIDDVLDGLAERPEPHILVLLDQVSDPHNIGAILRSAAAFAAAALILPEHGAPAVTGVLAKAASGALERVPLLRVANLARTLDRLKEAGFWCLGLDESATATIETVDAGARIALVLGAEGSGLRRLTRERCDFLARLPTRGEPASLNVSNAAAVALYALTRSRP